ncbi:hypothetical protein AWB71_05283 [Caballeronia peredens]|nr:hypothetical protein AWB71_05283 [Caballeronia peredens]
MIKIHSLDKLIEADNLTFDFFSDRYSDLIAVRDIDKVPIGDQFVDRYHNQLFGKNRKTAKWEMVAEEKNCDWDLSDEWGDLEVACDHLCLCAGYYTRCLGPEYKDFIAQTGYIHLCQAGETVRNDKDFMLKAIRHNPDNAQFSGFALRLDQHFVSLAAANGTDVFDPDLSKHPDLRNFLVEVTINDEQTDYQLVLYGQNQAGHFVALESFDTRCATLTTRPQIYIEQIDPDVAFEDIAGKLSNIKKEFAPFVAQRNYAYLNQLDAELADDIEFLTGAADALPFEEVELIASPRLQAEVNAIKDECGDFNPFRYLKVKTMYERLDHGLQRKDVKQPKKLKI